MRANTILNVNFIHQQNYKNGTDEPKDDFQIDYSVTLY